MQHVDELSFTPLPCLLQTLSESAFLWLQQHHCLCVKHFSILYLLMEITAQRMDIYVCVCVYLKCYYPCFINEKNGDSDKLMMFKVWENIQDFQLVAHCLLALFIYLFVCLFIAHAFPTLS